MTLPITRGHKLVIFRIRAAARNVLGQYCLMLRFPAKERIFIFLLMSTHSKNWSIDSYSKACIASHHEVISFAGTVIHSFSLLHVSSHHMQVNNQWNLEEKFYVNYFFERSKQMLAREAKLVLKTWNFHEAFERHFQSVRAHLS